MFIMALNVAHLSQKQDAFRTLETHLTLPRLVAPPATALQQDVYLLQVQSVNLQIFLETQV
jgi:hypothetical protein